MARRLTGAGPAPLGAVGAALIYLAAFSSRGAGTLTGTEPPPWARGWRKQVSLVAVSSAFALSTAWLDDRLAGRR